MAQKQVSQEAKHLMLLLLINSIVLVALYFIAVSLGFEYILPIYCAVGAVLGIGFVIYNRGFSGKGITPDMLPSTMSMQEKEAFIQDSKQRLQASRWVLTLLFPILLAIAADIVYLYLFPMLGAMFS